MYMGIDVGSVSTDVVIINEKKEIVAFAIERSRLDHRTAVRRAVEKCLKVGGISMNDICYTVGTGYGRKNLDVDCDITEISCHALGIYQMNPRVRMLIDIGGEDTKIIRLSEAGFVDDFIMNDKCSAGTGRFLENMARTVGIPVENMADIAEKSKREVRITSTCTVFAESEVISRVSEGESIEDIILAVHRSICKRILGMVKELGMKEGIALTGGVSKNRSIVSEMSKLIGHEIYVPSEPQIIGAYGAAIYAMKKGRSEHGDGNRTYC